MYRGSIFITYNSLIYNSSWYNLFDILTLSHSAINLINLHITDATIPLLGAINTVAAFSSLLYHRSKLLVYLSLISIFTIFFAKGVNTPYGMLYYFLVIHFPGDAGAIFDLWFDIDPEREDKSKPATKEEKRKRLKGL